MPYHCFVTTVLFQELQLRSPSSEGRSICWEMLDIKGIFAAKLKWVMRQPDILISHSSI
jgi:hypothetical protein